MPKKTLNLGCGERVYKEYPLGSECINFDSRTNLDVVDLIGDVRDLQMFKDGEFDYILASDIIEHFTIEDIKGFLKEWARVLTRFGTLEIRTPNIKWAAAYYLTNGNAEFVSFHMFGGQDYSTNFHYVMFDRAWLLRILKPFGFEEESYTEEGSNFIMKLRKK